MIEITKKIDILILLKYLKIVNLRANKSIRFSCLFHNSKSGLSCEINRKNKVYCWSCEKAFDVIDIYIKYKKLHFKNDFKKVLRDLEAFYHSEYYLEIKKQPEDQTTIKTRSNNRINLQSPILDDKEIINQKRRIIKDYSPVFDKITNFYHNELLKNKAMLEYLFKYRKLNIDTIKQFKIGYSDKNNVKLLNQFTMYKNILIEVDLIRYNEKYNFYYDVIIDCLVIPVLHNGFTMHFYKNNFQAIDIFNPKYKALKNFTNTNIFYVPYGFSDALETIKKTRVAIIHEGFYDVMNAHQNGFKNAIALITIKSYLSKFIIDFFKKYNVKIIIALDNDDAGRNNSIRLQMQLNNENIKNTIKNISKNDCKDADDILKKYGFEMYKQTYLN